MVSNTHSLKFLCCFADNIIAQFTIEILPAISLIIDETSVKVVRRISSPCKGEMPAKQAERVLLERVYKVFNYEYKEKNHEKNNSGAGVGGVTERV